MSSIPLGNRGFLCAHTLCTFLVHTNSDFGGYCCRVCHWASAHRRVSLHGTQCERYDVLAPALVPVGRAPSDWIPKKPLSQTWRPETERRKEPQQQQQAQPHLAAEAVDELEEASASAEATAGLLNAEPAGGEATVSADGAVLELRGAVLAGIRRSEEPACLACAEFEANGFLRAPKGFVFI